MTYLNLRKKGMVYAAFCGTGKTYFCENYKNVIEFECWKYDGVEFPYNYVSDIKSKINKVDYIFISTNPIGLKELYKQGIEITLIYPKIGLKEEYLQRYKNRESSDEFINRLNEEWVNWITELRSQNYCKHIILDKNQYITDILLPL
jgi:hypothetical protein